MHYSFALNLSLRVAAKARVRVRVRVRIMARARVRVTSGFNLLAVVSLYMLLRGYSLLQCELKSYAAN